jgi:hypothetical protein
VFFLIKALALEIKKIKKETLPERNLAIVEFLAANTNDDSDDESSASGEEDDPEDTTKTSNKKKKEKVSKAKRRRKKLLKEKEVAIRNMKADKKMSQDILYVKSIVKSLNKNDDKLSKIKPVQNTSLSENKPIASQSQDTSSLLLTDELTSNLRTLRTRSCPIKNQISHMISNGEAFPKNRRKPRAFEKPHAAKRVKWVAKYKYS